MLIPEEYRERYDRLALSHPWMREMRDAEGRECQPMSDLMEECAELERIVDRLTDERDALARDLRECDENRIEFRDQRDHLEAEVRQLQGDLKGARKSRDHWRRVAGKHAAEVQRLKSGRDERAVAEAVGIDVVEMEDPQPEPPDEWYLSGDGEHFGLDRYGSEDEAVNAALADYRDVKSGKVRSGEVFDRDAVDAGWTTFFVGKRMWWWPAIDEDYAIFSAVEQAGDYAGEFAEGWLEDVTAEQRQRLRDMFQAAFDRWLRETGNEPSFFVIEQARELDAEDYELEGDVE